MLKAQEILNEVGFSDTEAKIYLSLLELGPAKAGGILKKTGLQNSVVHLILGRLVERGFVAYVQQGRIRHYQAVSPQNILRILDEKRKRFEALIPALLALQHSPEALSAQIYEGTAGFRCMLYDLIDEGQAGDEFVFSAFYHSDPAVQREIYPFYTEFEKERERRGFILKGIVPEQVRESFRMRNQKILRYTKIPLLLNINVFRDKISLTPWGSSSRKVSFLLNSSELAEQFRAHFLAIWHSLTPEPAKQSKRQK